MLPMATAMMFLGLVGSTAIIGSPAPRVASPNNRYSSETGSVPAGAAVTGPSCCSSSSESACASATPALAMNEAAQSAQANFLSISTSPFEKPLNAVLEPDSHSNNYYVRQN